MPAVRMSGAWLSAAFVVLFVLMTALFESEVKRLNRQDGAFL